MWVATTTGLYQPFHILLLPTLVWNRLHTEMSTMPAVGLIIVEYHHVQLSCFCSPVPFVYVYPPCLSTDSLCNRLSASKLSGINLVNPIENAKVLGHLVCSVLVVHNVQASNSDKRISPSVDPFTARWPRAIWLPSGLSCHSRMVVVFSSRMHYIELLPGFKYCSQFCWFHPLWQTGRHLCCCLKLVGRLSYPNVFLTYDL